MRNILKFLYPVPYGSSIEDLKVTWVVNRPKGQMSLKNGKNNKAIQVAKRCKGETFPTVEEGITSTVTLSIDWRARLLMGESNLFHWYCKPKLIGSYCNIENYLRIRTIIISDYCWFINWSFSRIRFLEKEVFIDQPDSAIRLLYHKNKNSLEKCYCGNKLVQIFSLVQHVNM